MTGSAPALQVSGRENLPISVSWQKTSVQNFYWAIGSRKYTSHLGFEANCHVLGNPRNMGPLFTDPSNRKPKKPLEAETVEKTSKEVHEKFID